MAGKLTDAKLKGLKPPASGQVELADSDVTGLRARVGKGGAITFVLRKRVGNKVHNISIGRYGPRFGLADARRKARALASDLEAGKPPPMLRARSATKAETIRGLVPQYLADKSELRSAAEKARILNGYVLPEIGDRLADTVTRTDVTRLIAGIAKRAPTMARAVHAQLSAFYTWALPVSNACQPIPARLPGDQMRRSHAIGFSAMMSSSRFGALLMVKRCPGGLQSSC